MPARKVDFAPIPATYSRLPHDDELYVLRAFAKHSSHCPTCSSPYSTYLAGKTLCPKGHQRALDVAQYVFNKAGQCYSVIDLERDQRVQIEIPSDCRAVRGLLKAMERGMRLRRHQQQQQPIVSYDRNYYVPPRDIGKDLDLRHTPSSSSSARGAEAYDYQTIAPKRASHLGGSSSRKAGKGSSGSSKYYTIGSKGALPVPRGDEWYY